MTMRLNSVRRSFRFPSVRPTFMRSLLQPLPQVLHAAQLDFPTILLLAFSRARCRPLRQRKRKRLVQVACDCHAWSLLLGLGGVTFSLFRRSN